MTDPRKDEAKGTADFKFRGHKFSVSLDSDEWSTDFLEALEDEKVVAICRLALGPQQWATAHPLVPKVKDLNELVDKIAVALGFKSAGESTASSA